MSKNSPQQNYNQLMQWLPTIKQITPKRKVEVIKKLSYYTHK